MILVSMFGRPQTARPKADLLHVNLAYLLAWAELQRTMERTPGANRQSGSFSCRSQTAQAYFLPRKWTEALRQLQR